jgi:hypothetical protein
VQVLLQQLTCWPCADDLRAHLAKFGLHLEPLKAQAKLGNGEIFNKFGHNSPIQALLDERFLKTVREVGADDQPEDIFVLGEAATGDAAEMSPEECEQELKDLQSA